MCMMALGAIASVAGTAVSFMGQMHAADVAEAEAESQALAMEEQRKAESQANQTAKEARNRENRFVASEENLAAASSGFDLSGSTVDVLRENAGNRAFDLRAMDWSSQVASDRNLFEQGTTRDGGKNRASGMRMAAFGSLFQGAAGLASRSANITRRNSVFA